MPRRTPGTDNRVLHVCRLLNGQRVRYLLAAGVAANPWPRRAVRRLDGVRVPYLALNDLRASKRTGRAADDADLEALKRTRR